MCVCLPVCYSGNCVILFAIAGEDFETGGLKVTFQPGRSNASVCVVIIDDDIREGYEKFRLVLSIPRSLQAQGVGAAYPYIADVKIAGTW